MNHVSIKLYYLVTKTVVTTLVAEFDLVKK